MLTAAGGGTVPAAAELAPAPAVGALDGGRRDARCCESGMPAGAEPMPRTRPPPPLAPAAASGSSKFSVEWPRRPAVGVFATGSCNLGLIGFDSGIFSSRSARNRGCATLVPGGGRLSCAARGRGERCVSEKPPPVRNVGIQPCACPCEKSLANGRLCSMAEKLRPFGTEVLAVPTISHLRHNQDKMDVAESGRITESAGDPLLLETVPIGCVSTRAFVCRIARPQG